MKRSRRIGVGIGIALAVGTGIAFAVAGTITIRGQAVAGSGNVSACDDAWVVTPSTPAYNATTSAYEVSSVAYSGIAAACDGSTIRATVTNGANVAQANGSGVISGTSGTITLSTGVTMPNFGKVATIITGYPTWDPNASYTVGQRVTYNGTNYVCIQSYTGNGDTSFILAPSLWTPL